MNVIITRNCNLKCPYCFARKITKKRGRLKRSSISKDALNFIFDFLARSGYRTFAMIGGEPTLHANFISIAHEAIDRDFMLKIFTNGLYPKNVKVELGHFPIERLQVLVNVNATASYESEQFERLCSNLAGLGPRATLSVNIWHDGIDIEFYIILIQRYGLIPVIRVGIAQPIFRGGNTFLRNEVMPVVGANIVRWAEFADRHKVSIGFDCGFQACMFDQHCEAVLNWTGSLLRYYCEPVLDVTPELDVLPCFPLGDVIKIPLKSASDYASIREIFRTKLNELRKQVLPEKCKGCGHFSSGLCNGGCLSRIYFDHELAIKDNQ